ncbi:MAG TPA: hypothetical protein QGI07_08990 [Dehalococcoidia bacterium]|mgnify:FL=1|jgi:hypothetical protein|nr:hypothetical protein [Chloroflexota bacterium]MDP5876573.1 hypothetical protein [Dehalococcoidia bacterium]MDP7161270.1 hypothetical protein [Dehalococcoidia bacterium]MDP7213157.1 hypothetical protein [Dehalococcoidia bacterium]MDP7513601.1 hypothetical protein [Dehalococcoidia bacterium]|tara:strand:- start:1035 stop:1697 length:663 start_codon:yes stop_codon:yes gene_type:complete
MTTLELLSAREVVTRYGHCVELVPMDPNFHDISVGLYERDGVSTVWTFSRRPGVEERIRDIVERLVQLGGMEVADAWNRLRFPCGHLHTRPLKFLTTAAIERTAERDRPEELQIKDSKSALTIDMTGEQAGERYAYRVSTSGEAKNPALRLRAIIAGFIRYGEMEKIDDSTMAFSCGQRHDGLARLILPYSRNISAVEDAMEADALRGQMTTSTLGFAST